MPTVTNDEKSEILSGKILDLLADVVDEMADRRSSPTTHSSSNNSSTSQTGEGDIE